MSTLDEWVKHPHNVRFSDLCREAETLGFELKRVRGSHHHYVRQGVREILTLSPVRNGKAAPGQIRLLRDLAREYGLDCEGEAP